MEIEFRLIEKDIHPAYLKSLYDLIDEYNCESNTYLEERHIKGKKKYVKVRVVEIFGSEVMVNHLILRMMRYKQIIENLNEFNSLFVNE